MWRDLLLALTVCALIIIVVIALAQSDAANCTAMFADTRTAHDSLLVMRAAPQCR